MPELFLVGAPARAEGIGQPLGTADFVSAIQTLQSNPQELGTCAVPGGALQTVTSRALAGDLGGAYPLVFSTRADK
jgi:hypothetical protein